MEEVAEPTTVLMSAKDSAIRSDEQEDIFPTTIEVRTRIKTEHPPALRSCAVGDGGADSMDTNNNNNQPADESMATEAQQQGFESPTKNLRWESPAFSDTSQMRLTPGMRRGAYSAKLVSNKQPGGDPLLSTTSMAATAQGPGGSSERQFDQSGGRASSGRNRNSVHGLTSPDFANITGTPTSVSQLLTLPSSSLSLEGFEFPSPMGSGTLSPLTSARLGRKRQLSISPLSSSSLDLNHLIRTSPTSLVNYITNSRGSSAGSMGHLSPSLFSNPAHFQAPHGRPMQFTLRNSNYPFASSSMSNGVQGSTSTTSTAGEIMSKESNFVLTSQIKKEESPSKLPIFDDIAAMDTSSYNSHHGTVNGSSLKRDTATMVHMNSMKMESSVGLQGSLLEPVQEEPAGLLGSSDDEGIPADFVDYSSITENESEMDTKAWNKSDSKKSKRVYYSYPSVEEPHNNVCRWGDCNKQCQHFDELVQHVNSDHIYQDSRKEFVCHWTGCVREKKPFKAQYMLLVHMRRHTGEKPHKCTYDGCNKAYSRLENLKTHLRSHTGERPYICKYEGCGKAFSNASDCAKHMNRTHSDEKPYACPNPGCNKRYTDPSSRRKHLKNCQVNKKARTDDGMSGADEESSAETASTKSTNSNSSSSKKSIKPKKSEKRKSNNPPTLRASNAGPAFSVQQQAASSMLSGDNGYVSGGSQGYMSSHTGYLSSSGYDTEHQSIHGEGPEEITRILQEQRLSDPHDMAGSQFIPHSQDLMTSTASHVTSNLKVGHQRAGDLMMPGGHVMMPHPHHQQVMASPNQFQQQMPSFSAASQAGFMGFNPTPPQDDSSIHPSIMFSDSGMATQLSPHPLHSIHGADMNSSFPGSGAHHPNGKTSRTSSSGYSSFRSSSPNKHLVGNVTRKSPSDDGSVIGGGSLRGSIMTNSYSTFSSNSSRVSSPSSTSGRGGGPHPPHSPLQSQFMPPNLLAMTPHSQHLQSNTPGTTGGVAHFEMPSADAMGLGYPLKHSLRMSNAYPQKQMQSTVRRNSQDGYDSQSDATSRSWQYSSQSSRYSFARSELSDEQIEKLPSSRRDSFSKNQPLPLPDSMLQEFSPVVGMGMEFEQSGTLGMDFISSNTDPQSQQSQPSPMQLNVSEHLATTKTSPPHVSTLPLHHLDHHHHHHSATTNLSPASRGTFGSQVSSTQGTMFSQDSGINDEGLDMFFGGGHGNLRTMSMSPNMALGNMASFANSLPEENQYLEQLLSSQVK